MISFIFLNNGKDMLIKNLNKIILAVLFLASSLISLNSLAQTSYKYTWYAYSTKDVSNCNDVASTFGEAVAGIKGCGAGWADNFVEKNIYTENNNEFSARTLPPYRTKLGWEQYDHVNRATTVDGACLAAVASLSPPGLYVYTGSESQGIYADVFLCNAQNPTYPNPPNTEFIQIAVYPYCDDGWGWQLGPNPLPNGDIFGRPVPAGVCYSTFYVTI